METRECKARISRRRIGIRLTSTDRGTTEYRFAPNESPDTHSHSTTTNTHGTGAQPQMGIRKTVTELDDNGKPITYEPHKIKTGKNTAGPVTLIKDIASIVKRKGH